MSRQGQMNSGLLYFPSPMVRIVGKYYLESILRHSLHRLLQVTAIGKRRLSGILHTDDFYRSHTMRYRKMLVHQLMPSHLILQLEEEPAVLSQGTQTMVGIIFAVIVVTPNREDTIGSMQLLQIFHIRFHLIGSIVHQVAGKEHHLHPLGIGSFHHLLHEVGTLRKGTEMQIREMQNLIAIKVRRQIGRRISHVFHLQSLPSLYESIEEPSHHRQGRQNGEEPRHE